VRARPPSTRRLAGATTSDRTQPAVTGSSPGRPVRGGRHGDLLGPATYVVVSWNPRTACGMRVMALLWTSRSPTEGKVVRILRYRSPGSAREHVGVYDGERVMEVPVASLGQLWALRSGTIRRLVSEAGGVGLPLEEVDVLAPIDGRTEVWAAGVTYEISREARVEDSESAADAYQLVYNADRPELFFKAAAWRVVGDGGAVAIRSDSTLDVPEPEVALVINAFGEIVGYVVCDDVSSRSIEGENPLYLPQAKIYLGSCALGPMIRPAWEVADPYALRIELTIRRSGAVAWQGSASTAQLHRRYDDLAGYLTRADVYPEGVVLSTGTCLVPPAPFSLEAGDVVEMSIDEIGTLTTEVVRGLEAARASAGLDGSPS
jgi:2-dehydro-3-deoxy-D-arabinonate dehydratase